MRLIAFVFVTICLVPVAATGNDQAAAIIPLPVVSPQTIAGQVSAGQSQSFTYKVDERREVLISIEADNETCGAELRRDTERGFMAAFQRFPTTRAEIFSRGETLKVSFFQTRLAAMQRLPCVFSLTIR